MSGAEALPTDHDTVELRSAPESTKIMPGKVNVVDFIKHEHSLLGLWFNAPGDRPDVALCCCCCASTEKLERRHRIWLFCYVLIGTLFISIRASLGLSSSFGAFCLTIGVLVPSTCFFRSSIGKLSARGQELAPFLKVVRLEEILLAALAVVAFAEIVAYAGTGEAKDACLLALKVWGASMIAEAMSLIWKYLYCRVCCGCCIPKEYGWDDGKGDAERSDAYQPPAPV